MILRKIDISEITVAAVHHERVLDFITYACGSDSYLADIYLT